MDLFLNPAYMVAGAALISAPIIIHLINRMRYKRIRWAAMEFLLKSQKRNRRRLIIEQLILLALRCLLVALGGFLVARFIGGSLGTNQERDVHHFVVLDDTLSMRDRFQDEKKKETTSFEVGKDKVLEIAKEALKANSKQFLHLVTLSDLHEQSLNPGSKAEPRFNARLNNDSIRQLETKLHELQPSLLHVKPIEGIQWAHSQEVDPNHQRIFHFVTDLRETDWTGPDSVTLQQKLDNFTNAGGKALLYDVAYKFRTEHQAVALHQENIGIVDLRPETRFTAAGLPVQFMAVIRNYSNAKKNVFLNVKVNGVVDFIAATTIDLEPGENRHSFQLTFNKDGYNMVSAAVQDKSESGIPDDDTRVTVINVKDNVPILMIDGGQDKPNGGARKDSYYLQTLLVDSAKGYKIENRTREQLEKMDLSPDRYPCLYLLDVPDLNEVAVKKLESYVEQGGRVAIFVGDDVNPTAYNTKLWAKGNGIFPVPLEETHPAPLTKQQHEDRMFEGLYQMFFRDDQHPIFKEWATDPKMRELARFLVIDEYWQAQPRIAWRADPVKVQELVTLPNRSEMKPYSDEINEVFKRLKTNIDDPKYAKFLPALRKHETQLKDAFSGGQLGAVAVAMDQFLTERGNARDAEKQPSLEEYWKLPDSDVGRNQIVRLRDAMKYGDPLVVSKSFGKGQTIAFLTTAGRAWNDWGTESMARDTYPMVMLNLQKFLTAASEDTNRLVGQPLEVVVSPENFADRADLLFRPAPGEEKGAGKTDGPDTEEKSLTELTATEEGKEGEKRLRFSYPKTQLPGVYRLVIKAKAKAGDAKDPEPYNEAYVYNVDTENEGNLKRATKDMVERGSEGQTRGSVSLISPDMRLTDLLAPKRKDMSEAPWLYLVILLILIVEQALAVHLSFHLKGNEAQMTPGAAGEARTPVPTSEAA
jgi:hypothetical protein